MAKQKRKKYATGTAVKNYLTDPAEALAQNQINIAQAKEESSTNPFINTMKGVGNMAMQYGMSQPEFGEAIGNDKLTELIKAAGPTLANMKFGGKVPDVPVEVEGGEVAETPLGELMEFFGPDHKNGGIKIDLPEDTEIYSKRIKVKGKTMAHRKKLREAAESKISKLFDETPGDRMLKKTLQRIKTNNEVQDASDMKIQEAAAINKENTSRQKFQYGTSGVKPLFDSSIFGDDGPSSKQRDPFDFDMEVTAGDVTGMIGTLLGTFGGENITERSRATDTPNINPYADFGKDALAALEESKGYVAGERDRALQDINLSRTSNIKRGRSSARGVNTMRALDLASTQQADKATSDVYGNFANQMMQMFQQQSGLENIQDKAVMTGEEKRDLADRADKDAYFTALSQDLQTKATGLQQTGKNVNAMKQNETIQNLLDQLSTHGLKLDKQGNIIGKKK